MSHQAFLSKSTFYFTLLFCSFYILFFPVPYYLFPSVGDWFTPVLNPFVSWLGRVAGMEEPFIRELRSDSTGHYLFTGFLFVFSLVCSLCLSVFFKKEINPKLKYWFYTFLSYYLALTLLKYGA